MPIRKRPWSGTARLAANTSGANHVARRTSEVTVLHRIPGADSNLCATT
jgi:hypothetical protein